MDKRRPKAPIAYTDTQLVYCATCAAEIDLLAGGAMPINWLPFGPIDDVDDLPQKRCDRCWTELAEAAEGCSGRAGSRGRGPRNR